MDLTDVCRRYGASIVRRCRGMLGDPDEAQDAAQEVFVLVMNRGHQFRGEAELSTWIYRITTNHCLNRIRGDRRRSARAEQSLDWGDLAPADPYDRYRLKTELTELLAGLEPLDQAILVHRYLDGMTQAEIAAVTGRSRRTVGKHCRTIDALLARKGEGP